MLKFILIIWTLWNSVLAHSTQSLYSLSVNPTTNLAIFSFNFSEPSHYPYLPYFFIQSLNTSSLSSLALQMAYNYPPVEVQQTYPKRGVKILTDKPLDQKIVKVLEGVFGISGRVGEQRYWVPVGESNLNYYADPNDFVCTENIMDILRIMPCEGHSGVLALINIRSILQKRYVGIEFKYEKTTEQIKYSIKFIVQYDPSDPYKNLMKERLGSCSIYDQSWVQNGQNRILLDKTPRILLNDFIKPIANFTSSEILGRNVRKVVGRWYSLASKLVHEVSIQKPIIKLTIYEHFQREYMPDITKAKVVQYQTQINDNNKQQTPVNGVTITQIKTEQQKCSACLTKQHIIKVQITNPPKNIRIVIPYYRFMKGFELYEIIDRGGDEFVPALIIASTGPENRTYFSENVIDRLPEPDFSLPFHVITFTMAIAGYFWVSLWRSYLKVMDHKYKKQTEQKKKQQQLENHEKQD